MTIEILCLIIEKNMGKQEKKSPGKTNKSPLFIAYDTANSCLL